MMATNDTIELIEEQEILYDNEWVPSFDVKVLPGHSSDYRNLNFTWNVTSYNGTIMWFKMYFDSPEYISRFDAVEELEITFRNILLFVSNKGRFVEQDTRISREMPPMYDENDTLMKVFSAGG